MSYVKREPYKTDYFDTLQVTRNLKLQSGPLHVYYRFQTSEFDSSVSMISCE